MNIVKVNAPHVKDECVWAYTLSEEVSHMQGAHLFALRKSTGYSKEEERLVFVDNQDPIVIEFLQKHPSGHITPGITSEQVIAALIHRHKVLDAAFPHPENKITIAHLEAALDTLGRRQLERKARGVDGEHKV